MSDPQQGLLAPLDRQPTSPSPVTELRLQYEQMLGQAKTEQEHKLLWDWYRSEMAKVDPQTTLYPDQWKAAFPNKYPAYSGEPTAATGPMVYGRR